MDRRCFLWTGAMLATPLATARGAKNETSFRFSTGDCDVLMTVEFYDHYSSQGFWFRERHADRRFCLSSTGQEDRDCVSNFVGSIAVARYRIRARSKPSTPLSIRESVRTIDQDSRIGLRPPFERKIELSQDLATDIQAFGYETGKSQQPQSTPPRENDPWCLLRQDLRLGEQTSPFLVVHWKHTVNAISLLDVIPGEQTWVVKE